MAQEIRSFTVTTNTGVLKTAPQLTNINFPTRVVRELEIRIPPGPRGELGFAIAFSGIAIIPANAGEFIVTDDEVLPWALGEDYPDSGAWQILTYNTGDYPHTVQVRFMLDLVVDNSAPSAPVVNVVGLAGQSTEPAPPTEPAVS